MESTIRRCVIRMNSCATRCSTSSGTWRCSASAFWATSKPIAPGTPCTLPSSLAFCATRHTLKKLRWTKPRLRTGPLNPSLSLTRTRLGIGSTRSIFSIQVRTFDVTCSGLSGVFLAPSSTSEQLAFNLIRKFTPHPLEVRHVFADLPGHLWQLLGSENDQRQQQNEENIWHL